MTGSMPLDDDNRTRVSASYGFTQLSAAVAFQAEVLARSSVVRADLMLLLNSSSKLKRDDFSLNRFGIPKSPGF